MTRLIESDRREDWRYGHSSSKGFNCLDQPEVRCSVKAIHRVGMKSLDEVCAQFAYTGGSRFRRDNEIHGNRTAFNEKKDAVLLKRGRGENGNGSYSFSHFQTGNAEEVALEKNLADFDCKSLLGVNEVSANKKKGSENNFIAALSGNFSSNCDNFNDEEDKICRKDFSRSKKHKVAKVEVKMISPYCVTPGQPQDVISVPNYSGNGGLFANSCYGDTVGAQSGKAYKRRDPKIANGKTRKASPYLQESDGQERDSGGKMISNTGPPKGGAKVRVVSPYFKIEPKEGEVVLVLRSSARSKKRKSSNIKFRFTKRQKQSEAYRRRSPENTWVPPRSDVHLLQEDHVHDPWRILVICMLLNKTRGSQVKKVLPKLFTLCPDAKTAAEVAPEKLEDIMGDLGLIKRVGQLQRLSREYLGDGWTHVTQLHGVGKYGGDAYAIFCTGKWDQVYPLDHKLGEYWGFLRRRYFAEHFGLPNLTY